MKWYFSSHRIDYIVSNFNCQEAFLVYMLQCFLLDFGQRILISLVLNKKIENMKSEKSNQNKPFAYEMLTTTELLLYFQNHRKS